MNNWTILDGIKEIVIETEEEIPVTIAVITQDEMLPQQGYRIRLKTL